MPLIQRTEANSLIFKNTIITLWNYEIQTNLYWLKDVTGKRDMQLIYQAKIYAN